MNDVHQKKLIALKLPSELAPYVDDVKEIEVNAETVKDVFEYLDTRFGGFNERVLMDDGTLRPYMNIFVGKNNINIDEGVNTQVKDGDTLSIFLPRAGG
ncbi:MAG: MoaD/ThiS family protein [Gammaproteobacteria bacterium]|nr:MoaD/ThiS family protein [Gammaproteobacteria bacterium]